MKKVSQDEILNNIKTNFKKDSEISKDELNISLNKIFIDDSILNQVNIKSKFDKNDNKFVKQSDSIIDGIKTDLYRNSLLQSSLYLKSIYKTLLISVVVFSIFIFFGFGIVFAFIKPEIVLNITTPTDYYAIDAQAKLAGILSFLSLILPTLFVSLYVLPIYIVKLRSDNQISRIRTQGVTKEQTYLCLWIITFLLNILFLLLMFQAIAPIVMSITEKFHYNKPFYNFADTPSKIIYLYIVLISISFSSIGVLIGFKVKTQKQSLIIFNIVVIWALITFVIFPTLITIDNIPSYGDNAIVFQMIRFIFISINPLFYLLYGFFGNVHFVAKSYNGFSTHALWITFNTICAIVNILIPIMITLIYKKIINYSTIR